MSLSRNVTLTLHALPEGKPCFLEKFPSQPGAELHPGNLLFAAVGTEGRTQVRATLAART